MANRHQDLSPRKRPSVKTRQSAARSSSIGGGGKLPLLLCAAAVLVVVIAGGTALAFNLQGSSENASAPAADMNEEALDAAEEEEQAESGPFSFSVATTGDIIFGREVGTYVDMYGGASALANVSDHLAAADVTIANVEAPLSDDESEPIPEKDVYLISRPEGIESLKESDVTLVSLANNHSMDYGAPALKDTIDALEKAGIKHAGAGLTEKEAEKIAEIEVNGASVAFFSWTDIIPNYFMAYGDQPGVVSARLDMDGACKAVSEAKKTHDVVIVAMHWGIEYEDYTTDYLQDTPAHKLVDAGADVIIGNHPHVIQGIEFYKGSLISYSQGDFVFDHYSERTGETFILDFDITDQGIENVVATPVYLDDTYGIPSVVEGDHAQQILDRLATISDGMNTSFDIRNDKAYITPIKS